MSLSKKKHINESNLLLEKRYLNESAGVIRDYSFRFGWSEKGRELNSGGEITDDLAKIVNLVVYSANTYMPGCKGVFTAGNDDFHKKTKSRHSQGSAVDITLPQSCHSKFKELLNTFTKQYPGFSYIDEYTNPSKGSTGGHFHLSYILNNPETKYSGEFDLTKSSVETQPYGTAQSSISKYDDIINQAVQSTDFSGILQNLATSKK